LCVKRRFHVSPVFATFKSSCAQSSRAFQELTFLEADPSNRTASWATRVVRACVFFA